MEEYQVSSLARKEASSIIQKSNGRSFGWDKLEIRALLTRDIFKQVQSQQLNSTKKGTNDIWEHANKVYFMAIFLAKYLKMIA